MSHSMTTESCPISKENLKRDRKRKKGLWEIGNTSVSYFLKIPKQGHRLLLLPSGKRRCTHTEEYNRGGRTQYVFGSLRCCHNRPEETELAEPHKCLWSLVSCSIVSGPWHLRKTDGSPMVSGHMQGSQQDRRGAEAAESSRNLPEDFFLKSLCTSSAYRQRVTWGHGACPPHSASCKESPT